MGVVRVVQFYVAVDFEKRQCVQVAAIAAPLPSFDNPAELFEFFERGEYCFLGIPTSFRQQPPNRLKVPVVISVELRAELEKHLASYRG